MQQKLIFGSQFNKIVLPLLESAKDNIKIIIFDWRFESLDVKNEIGKFNNAIISAHNRGVNVRCIVNSQMIAQRLKNLSINARVIESERLMHTKLLIIDNKKVVVGSHNYSQSAFTSNYELSVFFDAFFCEKELADYFEIMWKL
jgi:phosphatidylserine/phosphatidylglycerophosphate/cardiolipin synthase-like enzyme